jgi:DNA excision repair protein ERCC-6
MYTITQTRQMLNILELWVKSRGWCYGRLDGNTPVGTRQSLINRFNTDDSVFVMLLTTRTGGVGTNLTGSVVVLRVLAGVAITVL